MRSGQGRSGGGAGDDVMKFTSDRPSADPDKAARRLWSRAPSSRRRMAGSTSRRSTARSCSTRRALQQSLWLAVSRPSILPKITSDRTFTCKQPQLVTAMSQRETDNYLCRGVKWHRRRICFRRLKISILEEPQQWRARVVIRPHPGGGKNSPKSMLNFVIGTDKKASNNCCLPALYEWGLGAQTSQAMLKCQIRMMRKTG